MESYALISYLGGEHHVPLANFKERVLDSLTIYAKILKQKIVRTLSCPNITCVSWGTCTQQNSFVADIQVGRINRIPKPMTCLHLKAQDR